MSTMPDSIFFDDTPKNNPWTEDALGYQPFSERLAKAILRLDAPNGYVIGVHGRWGSGKSTVLNFVHAYLDKYREEEVPGAGNLLFVDFRPWIIAGHDDLVSGFFKVLTDELSDFAKNNGGKNKHLHGFWRRQGRNFKKFAAMSPAKDPLIQAAATVGVAAIPGVGPFAALAAGAVGTVVNKTTDDAIKSWLERPSLQTSYDELRKLLSNRDEKIVVTIDDIDRLSKSEIKTIMQMVKSVGRLPNVIYILSYDRDVVFASLDEFNGAIQGSAFIEKIVQLELQLPQPSQSALLRVLDAELKYFLEEIAGSDRWQRFLSSGLHRWISVPRDVVRLSNSVKFVWPALKGEIDPQDLLTMEGLRIFRSPIFSWIRSNRDFLLGEGKWSFADDNDKRAYGGKFRASLDAADALDEIDVIGLLFPGVAKSLAEKERMFSGGEAHARIVARRGIGYRPVFDSYFSMFPSQNIVSKVAMESIISQLSDATALQDFMSQQIVAKGDNGKPLIGDFLEQISLAIGLGAKPTRELLKAFFAVGQNIIEIDDREDFLMLSPRAKLSFLIRDTLTELGPDKADASLIDEFSNSQSLSLCADIWVDRARELGLLPSEGSTRESPVTQQALLDAGSVLVAKIEARASDDTLFKEPLYFDIARMWNHLSDGNLVRRWVSETASRSAESLAKLSWGLLSYSRDSDGNHYFLRSAPQEPYYDREVLLAAAERYFDDASVTEDERRRICAVRDGLRRLANGQSATDY